MVVGVPLNVGILLIFPYPQGTRYIPGQNL